MIKADKELIASKSMTDLLLDLDYYAYRVGFQYALDRHIGDMDQQREYTRVSELRTATLSEILSRLSMLNAQATRLENLLEMLDATTPKRANET